MALQPIDINDLPVAVTVGASDLFVLAVSSGPAYLTKQITGANLASSILTNATATANRVLITSGTGNITVSTVTTTELGYLSGATSNIQAQIDSITSGTLDWIEVVGTTQNAAVNKGYITNNAGLVTVTLPATSIVGDVVRIEGKGAGGWAVAQSAGQSVRFAGSTTTAGAGGSLASTGRDDGVELLCIVANTGWKVSAVHGNIGVV